MTRLTDSIPQTMPALFERAALLHGNREAIRDGLVRLTFTDLDRARRQAARAFIAAGIRKGDRAAIWAPNCHEFVIAAAGLQSAGGVLVPLNTRFKGSEAADILHRSNARWLFTVDDFLGVSYPALLEGQDLPDLERIVMLRGASPGTMSWQEFLDSGEQIGMEEVDAIAASITPDDHLDLMFTSGTTGRPKAVIGTHGKTMWTYENFTRLTTLGPDDTYLVINPFFHTFGYKYGWMACVMRGARMIPMQTFDVDAVLETIQRERVTLVPGPPTIYQMILAHPRRAGYDLSSLRLGQTGAAVIPVELIRRMYDELGLKLVLVGYGLTECCGVATATRAGDDPVTVATTVGGALPGVEIRIVDTQGNTLPAGEPGEILIRGNNVMPGYFNDATATAEALDAEGFLHTGDIGVMDERGYIRITDRLKDMFIVGGFNCYPAEIENALYRIPGIVQAAVIGVPDERLGEVGKAFIVRQAGAALTEESVIAWCRDNMANFKVPRQVEFLDALPLNASGKVLKTALRERAAQNVA